MKRFVACALLACLLAACQREASSPQVAAPEAPSPADTPAPQPVVAPTLKDVVETGPRYIVGITYPPEANKYPGLAIELQHYVDAARAELMDAVADLPDGDQAGPYDLSLVFGTLVDTPRLFAIAADGSSYTGGAHSAPLVARFVWLPDRQQRLRIEALLPQPAAWRDISGYVREHLHAALSQRVDADELDAVERERIMRSAGKMIDEGSGPDADNFRQFEPVVGADGRIVALRFVFPPYQVGPYSDGVQAVEVPAAVLLPHVAAEYRTLFAGG